MPLPITPRYAQFWERGRRNRPLCRLAVTVTALAWVIALCPGRSLTSGAASVEDPYLLNAQAVTSAGAPAANAAIVLRAVPNDSGGSPIGWPEVGTGYTDSNGHVHAQVNFDAIKADPAFRRDNGAVVVEVFDETDRGTRQWALAELQENPDAPINSLLATPSTAPGMTAGTAVLIRARSVAPGGAPDPAEPLVGAGISSQDGSVVAHLQAMGAAYPSPGYTTAAGIVMLDLFTQNADGSQQYVSSLPEFVGNMPDSSSCDYAAPPTPALSPSGSPLVAEPVAVRAVPLGETPAQADPNVGTGTTMNSGIPCFSLDLAGVERNPEYETAGDDITLAVYGGRGSSAQLVYTFSQYFGPARSVADTVGVSNYVHATPKLTPLSGLTGPSRRRSARRAALTDYSGLCGDSSHPQGAAGCPVYGVADLYYGGSDRKNCTTTNSTSNCPVMTGTVKVHNIYWNPTYNGSTAYGSTFETNVDDMVGAMSDKPYLAILSQAYYDHFGCNPDCSVTFASSTLSPVNRYVDSVGHCQSGPPCTHLGDLGTPALNGADIQSVVEYAWTQQGWTHGGLSSIFNIYLGNSNWNGQPEGACVFPYPGSPTVCAGQGEDACALHGYFYDVAEGKNVFYSVIPYGQVTGGCAPIHQDAASPTDPTSDGSGWPSHCPRWGTCELASALTLTAHEDAETITDPEFTAWADWHACDLTSPHHVTCQNEIADECQENYSTESYDGGNANHEWSTPDGTRDYELQDLWNKSYDGSNNLTGTDTLDIHHLPSQNNIVPRCRASSS